MNSGGCEAFLDTPKHIAENASAVAADFECRVAAENDLAQSGPPLHRRKRARDPGRVQQRESVS